MNTTIHKGSILILLVCLLGFNTLNAQEALKQDTLIYSTDTTFYSPVIFQNEKVHSPHKASMYSAILPGLGQAYNKKYWKIPIIYALTGSIVYGINFNSRYYNLFRSAYRDFIVQDPGNTSYERFIPTGLTKDDVLYGEYRSWFENSLNNRKQLYKRNRDLTYMLLAGVYLLQIVDAAVDAHFYDFDISDDLSMSVQPNLMDPAPGEYTGGLGMQLTLKF